MGIYKKTMEALDNLNKLVIRLDAVIKDMEKSQGTGDIKKNGTNGAFQKRHDDDN